MLPYIIFFAVLLSLLIVYSVACIWVFRFAFLRSKISKRDTYDPDHPGDSPWAAVAADGVRYAATITGEEVHIQSHDGLTLHARLFTPTETPRATMILFHGYRSFPEHDFGGILQHYLEECHFRILMPDQRAHGNSEGKYITFGVLEKNDCVRWAEYAARRFGQNEKIILDGMSMGATTVMLASGEDLPRNIAGIVADCGYTSPDAILRAVGKRMHLPVFLLLPGVYALCRMHGFSPRSVSAPAALAKTKLPILLVHGMADGFVPYEMGVENYHAIMSDKYMVSVEGADHGTSFAVDKHAVLSALTAFFEKTVGKAE